jgi:hypothetical protein
MGKDEKFIFLSWPRIEGEDVKVERKWLISSMFNLVCIVIREKVHYVLRLGRNYCMSTPTRRHSERTHLSEVRDIGNVLKLESLDAKMKETMEKSPDI